MPSRKSRKRRSNEPAHKPGEQSSGRRSTPRSRLVAGWKTHAWVVVVAMGMLASREGKYEEAEAYLKRVLEVYPDDYTALEQLGLAFQHQGKIPEAIELFDRGRVIMPYKRSLYTINIAVLYKTSNRPLEAQRELESLLPRLESAVTPDELIAWWYLGELYREQGHTEQARTAYQKYLGRTIGTDDSKVVRLRGLASQALNNLKQ